MILGERIATFGFFIPGMIAMQSGTGVPDAQGKAALSQWHWLNTGRNGLTLLGWVLALRTLVQRG